MGQFLDCPATVATRRAPRRDARLLGRLAIAVEPLTIALFFIALCTGLLMRHQEGAILIAPIFGVAALLFLAYAAVLMISVTRAVIETYGPIYVVDGYVRYRAVDVKFQDTAYFVAVLDERRNVLGEWPLSCRPPAIDRADPWPALVEFTPYGGIHRIDGRSTGVLPDDIPTFGIGAPQVFGRPSADPRSPRLARRLR